MAPRGQARRNSDAASIESEIAHLRDLDLKALRIRWRGVTGRAAPSHLPKHLLFAMLAYRIQCDTFGDLDAASLQLLKTAAGSKGLRTITQLTDKVDQRNQELLPGAVLTREWNGHNHRVMVVDGVLPLKARPTTASQRSRLPSPAPNGTDPRFFGLRAASQAETPS